MCRELREKLSRFDEEKRAWLLRIVDEQLTSMGEERDRAIFSCAAVFLVANALISMAGFANGRIVIGTRNGAGAGLVPCRMHAAHRPMKEGLSQTDRSRETHRLT